MDGIRFGLSNNRHQHLWPKQASTNLGRLGEEVLDQATLIFVFNPCEELGAELADCLGFVEGETIVHLAAAEVTGHAFRLEDWLELTVEVNAGFCC